MAATTGQLGLVTPTQGTLSGTWGDTVNNGITEYVNLAVAATLTLTDDGAVTLQNTTGDASATNITSTLTGAGTVTAQHAIIKVTGTLTTTKVITAPSYSKSYIVINAATGGSVTIKASGQTGVTIAVGDKALVAYNGTDYVRVGASAGGSDTQVQYNSSGNLAGSANMTFDGTKLTVAGLKDSALTSGRVPYATTNGELTDSTNMLFDGTKLTVAGLKDSALTSGRVPYATTSGELTDSTNLTFDGTKLSVGGLLNSALTASKPVFTDASKNLTSTGTLGVDQGGTSLTTLTANNVILGNGTSAPNFVAPSTNGNVLTSNGTTWVSQAPASSGVSQAKATGINLIFSI